MNQPQTRPKAGMDCYAVASTRAMSRLSLLVDLAALLTREVDLDALLSAACERVAEALGADRASIWLVDAERGDLVTRVALLPEGRTHKLTRVLQAVEQPEYILLACDVWQ